MLKSGIIIKGIGGFYYIETDIGVVECKARGLFRNKKIKPLVGDYVQIEIISKEKLKGYIMDIKERKVELLRPHVANVEQVIITMSILKPKPNYILLDKLLVLSEFNHLEPLICFNKIELSEDDEYIKISEIYKKAGYNVILTSVKEDIGIEFLKKEMKDKISVFSGPSGVGKSSLTNKIQPGLELIVGEISEKISRGKHTTRHTELIELKFGGYVLDTPGFTSLDLTQIKKDQLKYYYREFVNCENSCKFNDCDHINEIDCAIKKEVENSTISKMRYNSYKYIYKEIEDRKERY